MRSFVVLNPPKAVAGHPIEILEIERDPESFIWLIALRIFTSDRAIECRQRYDKDKRVTIDTIPESDEAYRLLLASRGPDQPLDSPNPLAEAIEAIIRS